ncbi:MAG: hypothetical protein D6734_03235 [Candidatus Schekmanbacteria bacterium]|nr:MAG: hypothetical protein D6734_03235 [Candidatus Schekmanbacteria bacterium]
MKSKKFISYISLIIQKGLFVTLLSFLIDTRKLCNPSLKKSYLPAFIPSVKILDYLFPKKMKNIGSKL